MAFCGTNFSDEKKEEEPAIDHSLKNIVAFSTTKKKMSNVRQSEGLFHLGKDNKIVDRRTKVVYADPKFASFSFAILCQVTAKLPSKAKVVGSGSVIFKGRGLKAKPYVLTCAHNLAAYSAKNGSTTLFNSMYAYKNRQGEKSWNNCLRLDEKATAIHPKFDGQPDSGYDIALCRQVIDYGPNTNSLHSGILASDTLWIPFKPNDLKKGLPVEISGYPGEKEGHPWTHRGKILDITKSRNGGYVLWHDVDCTAGNSGSPIIITDMNWVYKMTKTKGIKKVIIGIHTGQDIYEGQNFGTLLTESLYKWIKGEENLVRRVSHSLYEWYKWNGG